MNNNNKQQQSGNAPPRASKPKQAKKKKKQPVARQVSRTQVPRGQLGANVSTRLTKTGVSDIRKLRISWTLGTIYVGNGTFGTNNLVYLQSQSSNWLVTGNAATTPPSSGFAPIASSDEDFGQSYIADIEKHFARKIIRRMWLHVESLQPSTANNMMAVIAVAKGAGPAEGGLPTAIATAAVTANSVRNVQSVRGSFPVSSWENKTIDITEYIGGGSGALQNEFDIGSGPGSSIKIWTTSGVATTLELSGVVPASICVAGNSTTASLAGTVVFNVIVEQEVDYVDFIGAMQNYNPI
jgi:hypothetical protein